VCEPTNLGLSMTRDTLCRIMRESLLESGLVREVRCPHRWFGEGSAVGQGVAPRLVLAFGPCRNDRLLVLLFWSLIELGSALPPTSAVLMASGNNCVAL
jgi:hypothetical protein